MIFCDCLAQQDEAAFLALNVPGALFNFRRYQSFRDPEERVASLVNNVMEASLGNLVSGWPTDSDQVWKILDQDASHVGTWHLRSFVMMAIARNMMVLLDPVTTSNVDITRHITAAQMMGYPIVGVLPDLRAQIDTALLAHMDLIVPVTAHPKVAAMAFELLTTGAS